MLFSFSKKTEDAVSFSTPRAVNHRSLLKASELVKSAPQPSTGRYTRDGVMNSSQIEHKSPTPKRICFKPPTKSDDVNSLQIQDQSSPLKRIRVKPPIKSVSIKFIPSSDAPNSNFKNLVLKHNKPPIKSVWIKFIPSSNAPNSNFKILV